MLAAARDRVARATRTDVDRWVTMRQVHGSDVAFVEGDVGREVRAVDAVVTRERELALVVMVADCVPVLLAGTVTVAAVHAGWRGIVAGVVEAAIDRMRTEGDDGEGLVALVGPAIGPCCYEVGAEVVRAIGERSPDAVATTTWGAPSVDPSRAVLDVLRDRGVHVAERPDACTRCGPGWFSHRADASSGRQAGLVVRRSAARAAEGERHA